MSEKKYLHKVQLVELIHKSRQYHYKNYEELMNYCDEIEVPDNDPLFDLSIEEIKTIVFDARYNPKISVDEILKNYTPEKENKTKNKSEPNWGQLWARFGRYSRSKKTP